MEDSVAKRLYQLQEAKSLNDLLGSPGRCYELKGERRGQLAVDLRHPYRLVFAPFGARPLKPDGGLDWKAVQAVEILEIVDYH